jgi:hypothetical protein
MSALYAVQAGVFNDVPDNQAYPYIDIGENSTEKPWNTLGGTTAGIGFDNRIVLHICSRYQGNTEGSLILKEVMRLLNFYDLTVTGYSSVLCSFDSVKCLKEQVDKIETRRFETVFRVRVQ